jgi:3-hydroxy-D-aspartate aldolase
LEFPRAGRTIPLPLRAPHKKEKTLEAALETPALIVDLDAVQRNIARMKAHAAEAGIKLRPHGKTHKSPIFGRMQIAAGAVGLCCQKVGEAQILVEGGIGDILVTNEIVAPRALARLADLARFAKVRTVADNAQGIDWIADAAHAAGVEIGVLVDCDLGHGRTGVAEPAAAVALGRQIATTPGLRFDGLQAYHGTVQHVHGFAARTAAVAAANATLARFIVAFEAAGLPPAIVSGAGTGSFALQAKAGYTEWQCGTYIFMDKEYRDIGDEAGGAYQPFEQALWVLATVNSTHGGERVVVDAGLKSLSLDGGLPEAVDLPGWTFAFGGDEHGKLLRDAAHAAPAPAPALGSQLRLLPGHGDTTINLHDAYEIFEGGKHVATWPVAARGKIK